MSRNTMSFALPESMRDYRDASARDRSYGNTSEYLRELIRRDQEQQAAARLRGLITEGLDPLRVYIESTTVYTGAHDQATDRCR